MMSWSIVWQSLGWYSHDARPDAIAAACSFLALIEAWAPAPFVAPVATTGAVQLEWEPHALCYLELRFDGETIQCSAVNLDCSWWDVKPRTPVVVETDWMGRGQAFDLVRWLCAAPSGRRCRKDSWHTIPEPPLASRPRSRFLQLLAQPDAPVHISEALASAGLLPPDEERLCETWDEILPTLRDDEA